MIDVDLSKHPHGLLDAMFLSGELLKALQAHEILLGAIINTKLRVGVPTTKELIGTELRNQVPLFQQR